ncbi:hypothetical protein Moror_11077 [Moniliophthora roreri MCA 2997]|uniref:Uncharacterized protein n=1 Tax=Moniliophthora roreri (strain MCA 2997) TaxID=1381753 RepID=V2WVL8_MONRO|nr:hypothetical protein Moror_11077 [Moniliophthora roreri MCA 2997]
MDTIRNIVRDDIGPSIPKVPFEYFMSSCPPPVDKKTASKVYKKLIGNRTLSKEGWKDLKFNQLKKGKSNKQFNNQRKTKCTNCWVPASMHKPIKLALSEGDQGDHKPDTDGLLLEARVVTEGLEGAGGIQETGRDNILVLFSLSHVGSLGVARYIVAVYSRYHDAATQLSKTIVFSDRKSKRLKEDGYGRVLDKSGKATGSSTVPGRSWKFSAASLVLYGGSGWTSFIEPFARNEIALTTINDLTGSDDTIVGSVERSRLVNQLDAVFSEVEVVAEHPLRVKCAPRGDELGIVAVFSAESIDSIYQQQM